MALDCPPDLAQDTRMDPVPNKTKDISANDYTSNVDEIGDEGNVSNIENLDKSNDNRRLSVRAGEIRASLTIKPQKSSAE